MRWIMRVVLGLTLICILGCGIWVRAMAVEKDSDDVVSNDIAVSAPADRVNAAEATVATEEELEFASALIWEELAAAGRSATRVVSTGEGRVAEEWMLLFSAGVDAADGSKYTALWHYAVSPDGKVYSMNPSRGTGWSPVQNAEPEGRVVTHSLPADLAVHNGIYVRSDSTEKSNGILLLKSLTEELLLFELRLFCKGRELDIAGMIPVTESGRTRYDAPAGNAGEFLLSFYVDRELQVVSITHKGALKIVPDGLYRFSSEELNAKSDTAVEMIKNLSPALTSLNVYNAPAVLKCVRTEQDASTGVDRFIITAENGTSGEIFAKFSVAANLSSVYRIDDDREEPVLIFGVEK